MEKDLIEQAALRHAMSETGLDYIGEVACENGFIKGAQWRINSVWHDASERPKFPGKFELVKFFLLCKNGECGYSQISNDDWDDVNEMAKFIKWAYVDDLLPEIEEK